MTFERGTKVIVTRENSRLKGLTGYVDRPRPGWPETDRVWVYVVYQPSRSWWRGRDTPMTLAFTPEELEPVRGAGYL